MYPPLFIGEHSWAFVANAFLYAPWRYLIARPLLVEQVQG